MEQKRIVIKISGKAGEGIKVSGLILGRALSRLGYSIFGYNEYPSLIRGGNNNYQIHAGINDVFSQIEKVDLLIALNEESVKLHQAELTSNSLILYDPSKFNLEGQNLIGKYLPINFENLAVKVGAKPVSANMVSLACALTLLNLPLNTLNDIIKLEFADKPREVVETNLKASLAGQAFINKNFSAYKLELVKPEKIKERMVITGNEAVSLGALAGGLQFFSAYPMSPATSILHYLAKVATAKGIVVKHAEDEVSVINMALGASFAGVRSMVATSGGGLCLMAESIGLAGIAEIPIVVVNAMRPGPAVGLPTWTGQGDLLFSLHLGNDEFPRIVLAPGDAQEGFDLTKMAFFLAEKYQLPVLILLDKYFSENDYSPLVFASLHQNERLSLANIDKTADLTPYKRYELTKSSISPRTLPGERRGIHQCNSYEHDELGFSTEDGEIRSKMMEKRMAKLVHLSQQIPVNQVYGPKDSPISLVSWGSNKGPILEALKSLPQVNFLHLNWLWPFPTTQIKDFLSSAKKIIVVEANYAGQLAILLRQQTKAKVDTLLKYNGRPFYPEEIISKISNI